MLAWLVASFAASQVEPDPAAIPGESIVTAWTVMLNERNIEAIVAANGLLYILDISEALIPESLTTPITFEMITVAPNGPLSRSAVFPTIFIAISMVVPSSPLPFLSSLPLVPAARRVVPHVFPSARCEEIQTKRRTRPHRERATYIWDVAGRLVALFGNTKIQVMTADLQKEITSFPIGSRVAPQQLEWCGSDSVVVG
jgi:hypothetical protein